MDIINGEKFNEQIAGKLPAICSIGKKEGTMAKKTVNDEEKNKVVKAEILRAAKYLFSKKGYDGTTVRQICEEANVSLALVSYHFGGKENVFYALFEPLRESFMTNKYDLSDSLGALKEFCKRFILYRHEEHELINILQQEIVMNSPRIEMLKDVFLPSWEELRVILLACKEQKMIHFPSVDLAIDFIMGTLMYSYHNSFLNRASLSLTSEEVADYAVSFILDGLGHPAINSKPLGQSERL